ncbi:hypothetical protein 7908G4G3_23 [Haloquadratum phage sp.]|nr:hypothetical protein 7908G4G3_23 [Haloquadratum phage sp.]
MAKDKRQIGVKVDPDVWQQFRQDVMERHGSVRGALGIELENALIDYIQAGQADDQLTRIESDVATAVAMLSEIDNSEADGGSTKPMNSDSESARARNADKPQPNQPRQDKLNYLLNKLLENNPCNRESGQLAKDDFTEIIKTEYNFSDDTVEEYKTNLISMLDAHEHPVHGQTFAWGERYEEIVDELRDEADREIENL